MYACDRDDETTVTADDLDGSEEGVVTADDLEVTPNVTIVALPVGGRWKYAALYLHGTKSPITGRKVVRSRTTYSTSRLAEVSGRMAYNLND